MKILFLNTDLGYGGAEKMLAWAANQMTARGLDVTFLTYRDEHANYQKLDERVRRVHIQLENDGGGIVDFFRTSRALRSFIKQECFDVAIAFLTPSQIRLVQACKGTKTKVLLSHRADPYLKNSLTGIRKLVSGRMKRLFHQADAYVFQTKKAQAFFPDYIQAKSVVIPNPIKPLVRTIARSPEKRIVNVSRLELVQKRQDLIIEAFNKICSKYQDFTLEFYGSGPDEQYLRELAKTNSRIIFKGVTTNVAEAIQNAAIFVLSSDYEGIPNALLEAMSVGVPCVSTDCSPGGASLLIDSREKGIIVECGNADKLADAMDYMLSHQDYAEAVGLKAMDVNERFSEASIAKSWYEFITKLIHES